MLGDVYMRQKLVQVMGWRLFRSPQKHTETKLLEI